MSTDINVPAHRSSHPIAVDATGGDKGIDVQVEGAVLAYKEFGCRSILVGPEDTLKSKLELLGGKYFPISVRHAPDTIEMGESPVRAVRKKPMASLCVAYDLVNSGVASAIISAGNTGAMMAAGKMICGLLPGIERPAIATLIPAAGDGNPNVVLDSGANVDCHAHNLVQFAVMGSIYYSTLFGDQSPKVALLSNGEEPSKGNDITRAAYTMLQNGQNVNFVGYVEGRDVATGKADVIVCDGFVGNVLLKAMEGSVRLVFGQLRHEAQKGFFRKISFGLSRGVYRDVFAERFDYTAHGGAPLLGLTRLALVLHGSSDSRAVKNAIRVADEFASKKMVQNIALALTQLEETMPDTMNGEILTGVFGKNRNGLTNGTNGYNKDNVTKEVTESKNVSSERTTTGLNAITENNPECSIAVESMAGDKLAPRTNPDVEIS